MLELFSAQWWTGNGLVNSVISVVIRADHTTAFCASYRGDSWWLYSTITTFWQLYYRKTELIQHSLFPGKLRFVVSISVSGSDVVCIVDRLTV